MASEQTTSDANNAQIGMEQEMEIQVEEDDELAAEIRNTRGPTTCGKLDRLLKKDGQLVWSLTSMVEERDGKNGPRMFASRQGDGSRLHTRLGSTFQTLKMITLGWIYIVVINNV